MHDLTTFACEYPMFSCSLYLKRVCWLARHHSGSFDFKLSELPPTFSFFAIVSRANTDFPPRTDTRAPVIEHRVLANTHIQAYATSQDHHTWKCVVTNCFDFPSYSYIFQVVMSPRADKPRIVWRCPLEFVSRTRDKKRSGLCTETWLSDAIVTVHAASLNGSYTF